MFMAPELLCPGAFNRPGARPTQPADIYALGMVIYEVLTGSQPFHEEGWKEFEIVYHVMCGVRPTKPANVEQIGFVNGTWELVQECWSRESTRRPTVDRVLSHLTCAAACSKVVAPTPDKPREDAVNSTGSGSSRKPPVPPSYGCSHLSARLYPTMVIQIELYRHYPPKPREHIQYRVNPFKSFQMWRRSCLLFPLLPTNLRKLQSDHQPSSYHLDARS